MKKIRNDIIIDQNLMYSVYHIERMIYINSTDTKSYLLNFPKIAIKPNKMAYI